MGGNLPLPGRLSGWGTGALSGRRLSLTHPTDALAAWSFVRLDVAARVPQCEFMPLQGSPSLAAEYKLQRGAGLLLLVRPPPSFLPTPSFLGRNCFQSFILPAVHLWMVCAASAWPPPPASGSVCHRLRAAAGRVQGVYSQPAPLCALYKFHSLPKCFRVIELPSLKTVLYPSRRCC